MSKKYFLGLALLMFLMGCAAKPTLRSPVLVTLPTWDERKGFVILSQEDSLNPEKATHITEIKVAETGFTSKCDLGTVTNLIKESAMALGANTIVVKELKAPDFWSSCYRMTADAYYLEDIHKYEKYIKWYEDRPLKIRDFKADTTQRPFAAVTATQIGYFFTRGETREFWYLNTSANFDCNKSYFKATTDSIFVLDHEQRHFDIAEIYARKLLSKLDSKRLTINTLSAKLPQQFTQIIDELEKEQDKYDYEVYNDKVLQVKWNEYIRSKLKEYDDYSEKRIKVYRK